MDKLTPYVSKFNKPFKAQRHKDTKLHTLKKIVLLRA